MLLYGDKVEKRLEAGYETTTALQPQQSYEAIQVLQRMAQRTHAKTYGAERGLGRVEGFSDAVFAIMVTLLIVEIKVPGSPDGPQGYIDLARAMAEQWREHLALVLC